MEVKGYKCFHNGLTNSYGRNFSIGQIYISSKILKFGNNGHGFHFCKNIEDTFRFFDTENKDVCVCEVTGSGKIIECNDEYNGYYNMYCAEKLKIERLLTREEVIHIGLNLNDIRVKRFISTFSLTEEEIQLFKEKYSNNIDILNAIAYYQENDKDVYFRRM